MENETAKMSGVAEEMEFNGKPVLALKRDEWDKYPLRFGLGKAALILGNLEAIRSFQARHRNRGDAA